MLPLLILSVCALATGIGARWLLLPLVRVAARSSRRSWDDAVISSGLPSRLSWLLPLAVLAAGPQYLPHLPDGVAPPLIRASVAAMLLVGAWSLQAAFACVNTLYSRHEVARSRPIKGWLQVLVIVTWVTAALLALATVIGQSPTVLLSGLGAMTAVLMLVFRDTLLSLVAGTTLVANRLVRVGDWITVPGCQADGEVVDLALSTVQVQNWDKTLTVIPASRFLDQAFVNWRGMQESGGRRICRALHLDQGSVRFLDASLTADLLRLQLLRPYLTQRQAEVAAWNRDHAVETGLEANGRQLTNLGCFRAYATAYLRSQARLRQDLTLMVRHLEPGPTGLPLQIYAFTATTAWEDYESIQADLIDHLLAVLPLFRLRAFQHPTGHDWRRAIGPEET